MPITKLMGDEIWDMNSLQLSNSKLSPKAPREKVRDEIGFLSSDFTHSRNEGDALYL